MRFPEQVLWPVGEAGVRNPNADPVKVVIWVGVLIAAVVVVWLAVVVVRRRMLGDDGTPGGESLFSELRRMRAKGDISDAEYESARRALVVRLSGEKDADRPPKGAKTPTKPARTRPGPAPGQTKAPPGYDLTGDPLPGKEEAE